MLGSGFTPIIVRRRGISSTALSRISLKPPDPLVKPTRHRAEFSFLLDGSFFQTAEHFRDAPCLGDAAARRERWLRIEDFADRTDAGLSEMRLKAVEEMPRRRTLIGAKRGPSFDARADRPSP